MSDFDIIEEKDVNSEFSYEFNATKIKVVGIGDGGVGAINSMIEDNLEGVEFIVINTDTQSLNLSKAKNKIQIGVETTKGRGAGGDVEKGKQAAEENREQISVALKDADIIFLTSGFGGGTGTGATPIIAEIAKETDALIIAVISEPHLVLKKKQRTAREGIRKLSNYVDNMLVVDSDMVVNKAEQDITLKETWRLISEALKKFVKSITDIITKPGDQNIDYNDIESIVRIKGETFIGTGYGKGENKVKDAIKQVMSNCFFEESDVTNAQGFLINFIVSSDIKQREISEAISSITQDNDENADLKWGFVFDDSLKDEMTMTVIITGINANKSSDKDSLEKKEPAKVENNQVEDVKKKDTSYNNDINKKKNEMNSTNGFDSLLRQAEDSLS